MRSPLLWLLPLQAALLFWNLGLLAPWTDELSTLATIRKPIPEMLSMVGGDVHPPLYFLLAKAWAALPLPGSDAVRVRMLSAVWTLAATVLFDRLWLCTLAPRRRWTVLLLWCASPAVLLYGRMGRSYLMQVALASVAVWTMTRFAAHPQWRRGVAVALGTLALLYTHYVPGLALLAAWNGWMLARMSRRRDWSGLARVAAVDAVTAALYGPWLLALLDALLRWLRPGGVSANYLATGGVVTELALRLAYGATAFVIGETFPPWALVALPLAGAAAVAGLWRLRPRPAGWGMFLGLAAAIGYFGVAHWVSYPFVPARLLWLLPFALLALARLWEAASRFGHVAVAVVLVVSVASAASYFRRENFLNKGYAVPFDRIAGEVSTSGSPEEVLLLVDPYNTDSVALEPWLPPGFSSRLITPGIEAWLPQRLRNSSVRTVWIVRNTHDLSPGGLSSRLETLACANSTLVRSFYLPYAAWERTVMRVMGVADPPAFFYEVVRCRPRTPL